LKQPSNRKLPGLSIVEVLLSVTLLLIMAGVMLPIAGDMLKLNEMDTAVTTLASSLRNAQASAQSGNGDSSWGVKITGNNIIIFKGTGYSARDTAFDSASVLPGKITISGTDEVVFSRIEGLASFPGSQATPGVITMVMADRTNNFNINARGGFTY
jgi:type II secretory pathway pseudopilin PulG